VQDIMQPNHSVFNFVFMKWIFICLSLFAFSCTPDGQKMSQQALDSIAAQNNKDEVDTFSVKKIVPMTEEEKKQAVKEKQETNQIISDASAIIHQGDPDVTQNVANANGVVTNPDVAPSFPGGEAAMEDYIAHHQEYPLIAFQNDIKGVVKVKFVVESDGEVGGVVVVQGLGYGCDESAIELVSRMPKWIPGKKAGVSVRCAVILPLSFGQ